MATEIADKERKGWLLLLLVGLFLTVVLYVFLPGHIKPAAMVAALGLTLLVSGYNRMPKKN